MYYFNCKERKKERKNRNNYKIFSHKYIDCFSKREKNQKSNN